MGVQSGCRCSSMAAMPATCGVAIEGQLSKMNDSPPLPLGAIAARTFTPGAITSGLRRSPDPAISGPREENDAVEGAGAPPVTVARGMVAVAPVWSAYALTADRSDGARSMV